MRLTRTVTVLAACAVGSASAIYGEVKSPDGSVFGLKDAFKNDFKIGMSFNAEKLIENDPVCTIGSRYIG